MPLFNSIPDPPGPSATYPDIYDLVRARLQKSDTQLPDTDPLMISVTALTVADKLRLYSCIGGSYDLLSGADLGYFNAGIAAYVAASIRPAMVIAGTIGGGILVREKLGTDEWQYATPQQTLQQPNAPQIEDVWRGEGDAAFALIACVLEGASERAASRPSIIGVAGPSRARQESVVCPARRLPLCW